jgi:hypothetical protein
MYTAKKKFNFFSNEYFIIESVDKLGHKIMKQFLNLFLQIDLTIT